MLDGLTLFPAADAPRSVVDPRPLIVDSFAGGGGASTGIELALGRSPDIAINHSADALALHAANHPETLHLSENVYRIDPLNHLSGRHIGLMWFSPDCKDFSKAKGGAPVRRNIRDLAWIIPGWIERIQKSGGRVDVVLMENVEEFKGWGPLIDTPRGLQRDPERIGQTFAAWCRKLRKLGGRIDMRELRGCDYGAPTIRKRLFIVIRFDRKPIVWPSPTHGDPKSDAVMKGELKPWRSAAECIDWSIPCPSIFATSAEIMEQHGLRAVRPLAANTLARIARGMGRYVLEAERPFLVNVTHGGRVEDLAEPCRTITGAHRGEKALVAPSLASLKGTDRRDSPVTAPHPTVLAGGGHSALIAPTLANVANSKTTGRGPNVWAPEEPLRTITSANGHALVAPVLTYAQQGGGNRSAEDPHHTICASAKDQNSLMAATLVQTGYGERQGQAPRALDIGAPLGTVVAGGAKHAPAVAFLAQHNNDSRRIGGVNPGRSAIEPMATITATGSHQMPVAAFIARHFGQSIGHGIDEPAGTITAGGGGKSGLVAPWFAKYYGTGDGARTDEPAHTITVKDRLGHMQAELQAPPFGPEHEDRARQVAEFLRAHSAWSGGEFVTLEIDGATFVIVDIGMRMLAPRELFTAQGFPADYVIEGVWEERDGDWHWRPFPKDVQVSCCGNSVCPPLARALVWANCSHLAAEQALI
nr:DNA methyltransferase [Cereibacter sphaeroides f. sp. denitrificans]